MVRPAVVLTVCSLLAVLQLGAVSQEADKDLEAEEDLEDLEDFGDSQEDSPSAPEEPAESAEEVAARVEAGRTFLEENSQREGVIALPSGLQYKVLKKGVGLSHALLDTPCGIHFVGTTLSLTPGALNAATEAWNPFDSSSKQGPTILQPNQVMPGWKEAMQLMVEGDEWELYVPPALGYAERVPPGAKFKTGEVLIFRVELLKIKGKKKRDGKCAFKTRENCEPAEVALLDLWAGKTLAELKEGLASTRAEKDDVTAEHDAREEAKEKLLFMMQIMKAKRKDEL